MSGSLDKLGHDPKKLMKELMDSASELYLDGFSLRQISDELELNPHKARKILISAGVYQSDIAEEIALLRTEGKTEQEIMVITGLSKASVNSYLPYTKVPYKAGELSANAERIKIYRHRKSACEKLGQEGGSDNLWNCIMAFQGYLFRTSKGLKFRYVVKGGEIKFDRKEKTVTRSSVEMAYKRALEGGVTGPKKLGVFGSSYLYPMFKRFDVV